MGFELNNKNTWWFVSKENFMLNKDVWSGEGEDGHWDSIEQTWTAYYTYGYEPFVDAIKSCWHKTEYKHKIWKWIFGYYYQGERYPTYTNSYMSRDHLIYSFMCFIHAGMSKDDMYELVRHFRPVVSTRIGMHMTIELWLWLRLICGKKIGLLYYPHMLLLSYRNFYWNKFIDFITGFNFGVEENQNTYNPIYNKPKIVKFLGNLYNPTFSLKLSVNKISVLPDNWWSKKIKKQIIKSIPTCNYVFKIMMGVELTQCEITDLLNYKSMTGTRWSTQLNKWWSDRPMYIIEQRFPGKNFTIANDLEKDFLMKLYNEKYNNKM